MSSHNLVSQMMRQFLRQAFRRFVTSTSEKSHLEVERKFSQTKDEAEKMPERLQDLGYKHTGTVTMSDTFLPAAVDGEMLRVRHEKEEGKKAVTLLTFKQWVKTETGKERKETECRVRSLTALAWLVAGRFVAGHPLLKFSKERILYEGEISGSPAVVSIDDVSGIGRYCGHYLEIEVIQPLDADISALDAQIKSLAAQLLGTTREPLKRSYMDMLIESTQS